MIRIALACLALAACGGIDSPKSQSCRPDRVASLPLRLSTGGLLTVARIDDVQLPMIVDTGAEAMMVTEPTVKRLRLPRDPKRKIRVNGIGGVVESEAAKIGRFSLGGLDTDDIEVGVGSLAAPTRDDRIIAGLIGTDYLSFYDLDFDLANDRLDLWRTSGCGAAFSPPGALGGTPLLQTIGRRMLIEATIDGNRAVLLLDTGAQTSLIGRAAALRLGATEAQLAADPGGTGVGADGHPVETRRHVFAQMAVAGQTLTNVPLGVVPTDLRQADVLLGDDWLASRRVWVSYSAHKLFLMPPGTATSAPAPRS